MDIDFSKYPNNTLENDVARKILLKAFNKLGDVCRDKDDYPIYSGFGDYNIPKQFDFLVAMPLPFHHTDWNKFIGYVVQIRKKQGHFGSDIVLLRTLSGELVRWENQGFMIVPAKDWVELSGEFKELLDDEVAHVEANGGYTLNKLHERFGYIVE